MPRTSLTRPIPEDQQQQRGWSVTVNGAPVAHVESVVIEHPRFGRLSYGLTAAGHDGWSFHEEGGGGSVIVLFARIEGALHVAVVAQHRPHQGGTVHNAPRGFLDPGEDRRRGAVRELAEEVGLHSEDHEIITLEGEPANPNSTFFETHEPGDGVSFFAVEVSADKLTRDDGGWVFADGVIDDSPEARRSRTAEAISKARFIIWTQAARLGDMFTNAAVARLLAHLEG